MVPRKNIIRSLLSLVLLVLFSFSITPRKTLHDLFGCHKEVKTNLRSDGKDQVSAKNFHCSCQHPELQAPFHAQPIYAGLEGPATLDSNPVDLYTSALYNNTLLFSTLRGPPAVM